MIDFWVALGEALATVWNFLGDMEIQGISMLNILDTLLAITLAGIIVQGIMGGFEK